MSRCPHCHQRISARALWTAAGPSKVVCPRCSNTLEATPASHILVIMVAFTTGGMASWAVEAAGHSFLWQAIAQFGIAVGAYSLLATVLLRYRQKPLP